MIGVICGLYSGVFTQSPKPKLSLAPVMALSYSSLWTTLLLLVVLRMLGPMDKARRQVVRKGIPLVFYLGIATQLACDVVQIPTNP